MNHREELVTQVSRYLDSQDWHYRRVDDKSILTFGMNIKSKLRNCKVYVDCKDDSIIVYAICPINASEDVRPVVAEYITRANYGLKCGNFEMDYSDGEIRYKTHLRCSEDVPCLADVESTVDIAFLMMQRYGDGLVKCLMGYGNPEEDIAAAEQD